MQVYLLCLTLTCAWIIYMPHFVFDEAIPIFAFSIWAATLSSILGKLKRCFVAAFGLAAVCLSLAIHSHFHPRHENAIHVPSYLGSFGVKDWGAVRPGDQAGRFLSWIHAPIGQVESLLRWNGTSGRGFETSDKNSLTHVNFETGESWNVYPGQRWLPQFPTLTGSVAHPATDGAWTTLVYSPPTRR